MAWKAALVLLVALTGSLATDVRQPKFLFVSSSTSTSVSTTTSLASASRTCLVLTSTAYAAACAGRKKRALVNDEAITLDGAKIDISKVDKTVEPELVDGKNVEEKREGRFAWYYMTTTVTSISTSTSTSTTYTSTVSVSAMVCTPNEFVACGNV